MEGVHFMNCRRGVEVHFNLALEGVFRTMFEVQRFKGSKVLISLHMDENLSIRVVLE